MNRQYHVAALRRAILSVGVGRFLDYVTAENLAERLGVGVDADWARTRAHARALAEAHHCRREAAALGMALFATEGRR